MHPVGVPEFHLLGPHIWSWVPLDQVWLQACRMAEGEEETLDLFLEPIGQGDAAVGLPQVGEHQEGCRVLFPTYLPWSGSWLPLVAVVSYT